MEGSHSKNFADNSVSEHTSKSQQKKGVDLITQDVAAMKNTSIPHASSITRTYQHPNHRTAFLPHAAQLYRNQSLTLSTTCGFSPTIVSRRLCHSIILSAHSIVDAITPLVLAAASPSIECKRVLWREFRRIRMCFTTRRRLPNKNKCPEPGTPASEHFDVQHFHATLGSFCGRFQTP